MFLTRKIGGFLRGKATPGQVFLAALLAGVLGFVPGFFLPSDLGGGFAQAPGLILLVLFLVLVLNANLGVFGLVTLVAKLVSLVALPVSFAIGRALIDGPLQPLFKAVVNAPVTAWFGLDYYATTGGLVLGLFFGTASGLLLVRALMSFRRRMAHLEENSDRYQANAGKTWVRFLAWLLFGKGKGKKVSWQELANSERRSRGIRLFGVVLVVAIGASLWVFQSNYSSPLLTDGLRSGLTAANGATVDVGKVQLDLARGALIVENLAIADSTQLDKNLFAARALEASIDTGELLRKRLVIDTIRAIDPTNGSTRTTPGVLTPRPPVPPQPADASVKTIDDYVKDIETWKGRIDQAREWIEWLSGSGETPPQQLPPEEQKKQVDSQVAELGYAKANAAHLFEDGPLIHVKRIEFGGIRVASLGKAVDFVATNFSSNAALLPEPPKFDIKTADGSLAMQVAGPSKDRKGAAIGLSLTGLSVDSLLAGLKTGNSAPLRGGTLSLTTSGSLLTHGKAETTIDLPLQVTLTDTMFAIPGSTETKVERLVLPIGLRGIASRPTVSFDDKVLADSLLAAGKKELATFVQGKAGQLLGNVVPGAGDLIDPSKTPAENLDAAKQKAEAEAQKKLDEAKKAAEDAAKKAAEEAAKKAAAEAAKKGLGEGLKGLLPGKKN